MKVDVLFKNGLSCLLFPLFISTVIHAQQLPNILWITAEDVSPRFSFYGDSTVKTPNLERLANEGVVYDRAFATYGVCAPARHTLIMGMYPTSTGAGAMRTWKRTSAIKEISDPKLLNIPLYEATPPIGARCFTEYLRAVGYYCTNNDKTDYQFRSPITAWDENSKEAHWRNRPNKKMPFFSVFNFNITHESGIHQPKSPAVTNPGRVDVPPYYPSTPTVRQDIATHYDNIVALDEQIGVLLTQLEADDLLDKTIIFFFGDHGDGLPRAKRWVYDSGIRVPLVIRFPELVNETRNDELVSFVDFAPTILSLADIKIPEYIEGQAFLGKQKSTPRKYIYAFRDRMDPAPETIRAVRDQRFKYIRNYRPDLPYIGFIPYRDRMKMMQEINQLAAENQLNGNQWQFWVKGKPFEELYDTESDPHEIKNLAGDLAHHNKLLELRKAHEDWTEKYGDLGRISEEELIGKLWPPNGNQPTTENPEINLQGLQIELTCATEGASIAYRLNKNGRWLLYTEPFSVKGVRQVESKAIRLGWKESELKRLKL
ncbi:MAG: sulfatase [Bacteroidota bacterium]